MTEAQKLRKKAYHVDRYQKLTLEERKARVASVKVFRHTKDESERIAAKKGEVAEKTDEMKKSEVVKTEVVMKAKAAKTEEVRETKVLSEDNEGRFFFARAKGTLRIEDSRKRILGILLLFTS